MYIKELFEKTSGGSDVVAKFQTTLDNTFYNKGVARDYFKDPSDFTDLDKIKKNLIKKPWPLPLVQAYV